MMNRPLHPPPPISRGPLIDAPFLTKHPPAVTPTVTVGEVVAQRVSLGVNHVCGVLDSPCQVVEVRVARRLAVARLSAS